MTISEILIVAGCGCGISLLFAFALARACERKTRQQKRFIAEQEDNY